MELNKIHNEDCLIGMEDISNESVDAIITDPPYIIARENRFETMGRYGIDFGEWDKEFDLISWISLAIKKLKKGGNVVIFTDWKKISYIIEELEKNNIEIKDLIRIEKSNPIPRNRDRRFITDYEVAIYGVKKGSKWTFNRLSEKYERPLIKTAITPKSQKIGKGHPTQKPLYVMEWLVERLTKKRDIVLDPFMGSGTTAIACINTNRNYIGFELDEEYYETSIKRINNHVEDKQIDLFEVMDN